MAKEVQKKRHEAPEGGWGWVIVLSYAVNNMINIPIFQGFALLFRNVFAELKFSATDISTIININSGFGMMLGLMNGPLLRKFGFRKICIIGSLTAFVGICLTSTARTFTQFVIYYGLINSFGFVLSMASFSLALNTYFIKRRSKASGICLTLTGFGPVFMPLLISGLMSYYGVRGTALILAGLGLHSLCGALVLQPVKWHYRTPEDEENAKNEEKENLKSELQNENEKNVTEPHLDILDIDDIENHQLHELEPSLVPRRVSDAGSIGRRRVTRSLSCLSTKPDKILEPEPDWWNQKSASVHHVAMEKVSENGNVRLNRAVSITESIKNSRWYMKIVRFFDLDLLKDPIYCNIWLGMALAFTAEINFSLMTPIILGERNFDIDQTAQLMSIIAVADIVFRFLSPFVGDRLKIAPRYMYIWSLVMLIICRFGVTLVESYITTIAVCIGLGIGKGFRTVYWTLVIPNHVPLEKLASASGLQTVINGILLFTFGPLLGFVRDYSGSYNMCIHIINCLTASTVILWTVEYLCLKYKSKPDETINEDINL